METKAAIFKEIEEHVKQLNTLEHAPQDRFHDGKEQIGHYYIRYNDDGWLLAKVVSHDGLYRTVYHAVFGRESFLRDFLRQVIGNRCLVELELPIYPIEDGNAKN